MNFFKKISPKVAAFLIIVYLSFTLTGCPPKPTVLKEELEDLIIEFAVKAFFNIIDPPWTSRYRRS